MKRCELLKDCSLVVKKGSVVIVDDRQFEIARQFLKPIDKAVADDSIVIKPKKK